MWDMKPLWQRLTPRTSIFLRLATAATWLPSIANLLQRHDFAPEILVTEWANVFKSYSRRASSPFTDFIYSEDDPLLGQARREMTISQSLEKSRKKIEWHLCRHRYVSFRSTHGLGFRRPVSLWENNGTCTFPDGSWLKWTKVQVERIWDTVDINHLRSVAQRDYDNRYKR